MRRLVDSVDGVDEFLNFDETENKFTIERVSDLQVVADDVAIKHSMTGGKTELGWHIGSIPTHLLESYAQKRGIPNMWDLCKPEYAAELMQLCTDSDYRKFSPTGGRA